MKDINISGIIYLGIQCFMLFGFITSIWITSGIFSFSFIILTVLWSIYFGYNVHFVFTFYRNKEMEE